MPINATLPEQKERILVPAGNHIARCYSMIYLGTHEGEYQGKKTSKQLVRITWELPSETHEFEKDGTRKNLPLSVSREFTLSMSEKGNLRPMLETWRGKPFTDEEAQSFDITTLMGVPCFLNIIHQKSKATNKPYAFVSAITPMPKGFLCPDQVNDTLVIEKADWGSEKYEKLPDFLKEKIAESVEMKLGKTNEEIPTINLEEVKGDDGGTVPF